MENGTMMQYFEWYLPADGNLWNQLSEHAKELKAAGIDAVWLPPAYKGAAGINSVGYDVYDMYDLGEFNQKGSISTKYGTRAQYLKACRTLEKNGVDVYADVVLNHMMGADATENVWAYETEYGNRNHIISDKKEISAWTRFLFEARKGKYNKYQWSAANFSGTDWDDKEKKNAIFLFENKKWNNETDSENVNYDYLMGVDMDTDNPETVEQMLNWGKWYLDTVKISGFRLDAIKHISFDFYREWLRKMREYAGRDFFVTGEYWSKDIGKLCHYLDKNEGALSLFDVPLHFAFRDISTANGNYDLGSLLNNTLVAARPCNAVTFVDNHDTQPGQALQSDVLPWFKPTAYSVILLQKEGYPCVFYGDYYGIAHDGTGPVPELKRLLKLRKKYAYGEEIRYYDDSSVVGFTRLGDDEHPNSGLAVIFTDVTAGKKWMNVGQRYAGCEFTDALEKAQGTVTINSDGYGEFYVNDGSVSVWVNKAAFEDVKEC